MGRVYLAQHHRIERRAAIKVLLPERSGQADVLQRFFTEARATSSIRHPGIVEVFDCDVVDDQAYIVMEYLEGESLASYMRRISGLTRDLPFALGVVAQLAQALAAAHASGIIHRDLKPDNVFLCVSPTSARVVVKVLDFGIAKLLQHDDLTQTRPGMAMGTPAYMSPEQCRGGGQVIDARADIYSLGCILYEMICGRRLFKHEALGEMLLAHVMDRPESPLALVPDLPLRLNTLVMRMLAKEPSARPQTMDEVFAEIVKCLKGLGTQVPPGEILPAQHVIVQQPAQTAEPSQDGRSASQPSAPGTPPGSAAPPASSDEGPEAAVLGDTRFGLGGARLGLRGTQYLPPDNEDDAEREYAGTAPTPVPTTFGEAVGQALPRPVVSRGVRSAAVFLAVVVIAGVAAVAAIKSRAAYRPVEVVDETSSTRLPKATDDRLLGGGATGAPPAPDNVTIEVRGLPSGAQVFLDGVRTAGLPLRLPRSDRSHALLLRATGYEDRAVEIDGLRDRVVEVVMVRATTASDKEPEVAGRARASTPSTGAYDRAMGNSRKRPRRQDRSKGSSSDTAPDPNRDVGIITDI
jgi:serine/threonine-protein kinase